MARPATSVQTLHPHNAQVTSLAWSKDGQTIASGDKAGLVVLSNAQTGKTKLRLKYSQAVAALAFSPDSKILAVGRGREVRLLNSQTGAAIRVLRLQNSVGKDLSFSNDGLKLMGIEGAIYDEMGNDKFTVNVWQLPSGRLIRRWPRTKQESLTSALAPDGRTVAIATVGHVEVWSIATGKRLSSGEDNTNDEWPFITTLAFSPDSRSLATGGSYFEASGHFAVWNTASKVSWSDSFQDYASVVAFSPHNRLLAVGTEYDTTYVEKPRAPGGDIFLYNLKTHKRDFTLKGHKAGIDVLAWSPNGKRIASGSQDRTLRIWTLTSK